MILPYYTLEQASSVLNNKLKSDIYNPKSILVLALNYQIDLHVHFYGDWKLDFDCHIPLDLTNIKITEERSKQETLEEGVERKKDMYESINSEIARKHLEKEKVRAIRTAYWKTRGLEEHTLIFN